jgi:group I intron endonuclease
LITPESPTNSEYKTFKMELHVGIYAIEYIDKVYIGQTTNFPQRRNEHLSKLRRGKHENIHLQRYFDKYGENSLTFRMVEGCDESIITEREQVYINTLHKSERFNINLIACRPPDVTGRKHSESSLEKMRGRPAWNTGKKLSEEHRSNISKGCTGMKQPESQIEATRERMLTDNPSKRLDVRRKLSDAKKTFTEEQCIEVYDMRERGMTQQSIADSFGWSRGKVRNIIKYHRQFK